MMPQGGNRIEDEVPAVNWRKVFIAMVAMLLALAGYAAVEATRKAGHYDKGGPQATAELFVQEHFRYELTEQGLLHFHGAQETQVEKLGDKRYRVTGTVDVIQPNGRAREHRYSCTIRLLPSGEWAAEKVFALPTN
jgi:hypothetical protein